MSESAKQTEPASGASPWNLADLLRDLTKVGCSPEFQTRIADLSAKGHFDEALCVLAKERRELADSARVAETKLAYMDKVIRQFCSTKQNQKCSPTGVNATGGNDGS